MDVVDNAKEVLMTNTHDVTVDIFDEVTTGFIPVDEVMLIGSGVNDVDNDVSLLDAMRLLRLHSLSGQRYVMSNASHSCSAKRMM